MILPAVGVLVLLLPLSIPASAALGWRGLSISGLYSKLPLSITPVVVSLGYDPVWFGIIVLLLVETAMITPPVGINLFVVQGIRRRGQINDVLIGSMPFVVALVAMIALLVAFPGIALWLPETFAR